MIRYKMLGLDIDSSPAQYRTWVVEDQPDFDAQLYGGLKSGPNPLINVSAYIIYDSTVVANFNLPNPLQWSSTKKVLPAAISDSQLAIIDGYVYLFGGKISSRIYRATVNNPTEWEDTGANLPVPLYGSQLIIIDDVIYLLGGNDGLATNHIFTANVSDPLVWTDQGALLPNKIHNAQAVIVNGFIYLLGGRSLNNAVNTIFVASVTSPLVWADTGFLLPDVLYNSQVAIIDNTIYLFGGSLSPDVPTKNIYAASLNDPTTWNLINYLPYAICSGQFFTVGSKGYLITSGKVTTTPKSMGTRILRCDLSTPTQWVDTLKTIPGEITESQVAIIYDKIFLFGGNGNSVIFTNASYLKYKFGSVAVTSYGSITRTIYNDTPNKLDLFRVLGFPYWKTDYGS